MKKVVLFFALIVGLFTSASTLQAQTVNMSRYITLTVTNGAAIKLNFQAATNNTPVRIVSGSNIQNITVGTTLYDSHTPSSFTVTAGSTTMTIYGDLKDLLCKENGANLTAIDVSNNTQLEGLYCYKNNLTTLNVSHNTQLKLLWCYNNNLTTLDVSHNTQLTSLYCNNNNLTTLDVSHNTQLKSLDCSKNNLTAIDLSHNTQLDYLYCNNNNLTTLDVSHNTQLNYLECYNNSLTAIDLSHNTQLDYLYCNNNNLTSLDVSHNTQLYWLYCNNNNLTTLDLSHNTQLNYLYCNNNNLTSLDVSHNTQLYKLYCYGNNFSTAALDDIYCSLPDKTGMLGGELYLLNNASDPNHATVLATNAQNAIAKNWTVQYADGGAYIPTTTGIYVCGTPHPQPNMSRYITLTVTNGAAIKLDFKAAAAGTPIRIVSGSNTQDITVGTSWYNGNFPSTFTVTADGTEMKVYGDLTGFICSENGANLTAIDLSHNTELREFDCRVNRLTFLDLSHNTELAVLNLFYNQLTSLDLSHNTKLTELNCSYNQLLTLDISHNTRLTTLDCGSNLLNSLNVDSNRLLAELNCSYNRIPSLDISHNTQLSKLACYGNYFTRQVLDDIFCLLPDRSGIDAGTIEPLYDVASSEFATVVATNKSNATNKNWKVLYADGGADVPTTGKHKCSATDIAEASAEQAFTLYPNPVADVLYLSATARIIRIYNVYGIEVAHAADTDRVEVSHLPAGIYTVKADGTVAKMVKR